MNKDELVEVVTKHLRRLKREELVSLAERLDSKTLKLTDLTLLGEGGFGFQQGLGQGGSRGSSASGSVDNGEDDDEGNLLERGADAGRGLLRRAKAAVGG